MGWIQIEFERIPVPPGKMRGVNETAETERNLEVARDARSAEENESKCRELELHKAELAKAKEELETRQGYVWREATKAAQDDLEKVISGYQPVPQHPPASYPQGANSLPRCQVAYSLFDFF